MRLDTRIFAGLLAASVVVWVVALFFVDTTIIPMWVCLFLADAFFVGLIITLGKGIKGV